MATPTTFPTVEAVFPELAPTLECLKGLIARLSRTDALLWCGRLNLVLSNPQLSDAEQQRYAAACFLPDAEARSRLAAWVRTNPDHRELQVFFRGQILELIRWVAICGRDLEGDGSTFEDVATRRVFGQAAIVAGALWGYRVFRDAARVEQAQSLAEKRSLALATLRRTQVENARSTVALVGLGRGWLIWGQYISSIWPQVDEEFERLTGLTLKQYYCGLAMVFAQ